MITLAWRTLLARRRQTLLMLLGVFFGTASFITLSGLLLGFKEYLVDQMVNNSAHVHIEARENALTAHSLDADFFRGSVGDVRWVVPPSGREDDASLDDARTWTLRLKADPRVTAFSPQLAASVLFSDGKTSAPGQLVGCEPLQQARVTSIANYVTAGSFAALEAGGDRLALGVELQKSLGVAVGGTLLVSGPRGAPRPFKVVAVFKTGIQQSDTQAFAPLEAVQKVDGRGPRVNEIAVRLTDYALAAGVARAWSALGGDKVESWDQKNANFVSTFKAEDMVRFLSIGAVLLVAAFGIYNVLTMTVMQKRKDIAILRSLGYSAGDVLLLFFSQGLMLGIAGVLLGCLAGYGGSLYLRTVSIGGNPMGAGTGYLAVSLDPSIYLQAALLALAATSLSSVLPAYAAARLAPIEIIRAGAE